LMSAEWSAAVTQAQVLRAINLVTTIEQAAACMMTPSLWEILRVCEGIGTSVDSFGLSSLIHCSCPKQQPNSMGSGAAPAPWAAATLLSGGAGPCRNASTSDIGLNEFDEWVSICRLVVVTMRDGIATTSEISDQGVERTLAETMSAFVADLRKSSGSECAFPS